MNILRLLCQILLGGHLVILESDENLISSSGQDVPRLVPQSLLYERQQDLVGLPGLLGLGPVEHPGDLSEGVAQQVAAPADLEVLLPLVPGGPLGSLLLGLGRLAPEISVAHLTAGHPAVERHNLPGRLILVSPIYEPQISLQDKIAVGFVFILDISGSLISHLGCQTGLSLDDNSVNREMFIQLNAETKIYV